MRRAACVLEPGAIGVGLRAAHYAQFLETRPALDLVEVHSENFFAAGGADIALLEAIRSDYALSLHGVGLSLGSADSLDAGHLEKLAVLVRRFEPVLLSEHLSWSSIDGHHANDLLPLPFTDEALDRVVGKIGEAQDKLGRRILVENVSAYFAFPESTFAEGDFLVEVARRSGCGLLLDVNNAHVNAMNFGFDARRYLAAIGGTLVEEVHLAGFEQSDALLIDTHGAPVDAAVWQLYRETVERIGPKPTIVEWDIDLPPLEHLIGEARKAAAIATEAMAGVEA